ncbi:diguanylate cyclase domain-containing protein [Williamsia sp. SKLECPSW1]
MRDGVAPILRRWWSDDFDRVWSFQHLQSSGLLRSQKLIIGAGSLLFGISALLSLPAVNTWVHTGTFVTAVLVAITLSSIVIAMLWWFRPWPGPVASFVFIVYADICVIAVMSTYRDVFESMPGLTLLAAVTVYTVIHHGPRAVIVQTVAVLVVTCVFAVWSGVDRSAPAEIIAIRSLVVVPVTVCIPLLLVPLVAVLRRDASGSYRDDMTDLHNRRGMQIRTAELIDRGVEFSLLLIDIDQFKTINDEYGHAAGDDALVHVASMMRYLSPVGAVVARIGGDEFAIVLQGDHPAAERLAADLHAAIARETATGAAPPMTVSIGIATVPGDDSGEGLFDLEQVLLRADRAMYAAKNDGGARTVQA